MERLFVDYFFSNDIVMIVNSKWLIFVVRVKFFLFDCVWLDYCVGYEFWNNDK